MDATKAKKGEPMLHSDIVALGFSPIEQLSSNKRFASWRVEREGTVSYAKCAVADLQQEIANEVWFNATLNNLVAAVPTIPARAPRLIAAGASWFVCELFEGQLLAERSSTEEDFQPHCESIAHLLATLDGALTVVSHAQPTVQVSNSAPYTDIGRKVDTWVRRPLEEGIISERHVQRGKDVLQRYREHITPAFQHGDFVPWHLFHVGGGSIGIVDGEHASLVKPRYYDLAYLYSRLFTRVHAAHSARALLTQFLGETHVEHEVFQKRFLPVITQRALGMHFDALNDLQVNDYRGEAHNLLMRCLEEDLPALLTA